MVTEGEVERPYVAMTRDDSAEFAKWIEAVSAHIKKQNSLLCFYRKDLKEEICR